MSEPPTARILITGSRLWTDRQRMAAVLAEMWETLGGNQLGRRQHVTLVTGGAAGADQMAEDIWRKAAFGEVETHVPDYEAHDARSAPLYRNDLMVGLGADVCLAFPTLCKTKNCFRGASTHLSHGTEYTIKKARAAGIKTYTFVGDDI